MERRPGREAVKGRVQVCMIRGGAKRVRERGIGRAGWDTRERRRCRNEGRVGEAGEEQEQEEEVEETICIVSEVRSEAMRMTGEVITASQGMIAGAK